MTPGPFVRPLTTPGLVDAEPLTLDPDVEADLQARLDAMRAARAAAWVSGQGYVVSD